MFHLNIITEGMFLFFVNSIYIRSRYQNSLQNMQVNNDCQIISKCANSHRMFDFNLFIRNTHILYVANSILKMEKIISRDKLMKH